MRRRLPLWRLPPCRRALILSAAVGLAVGCVVPTKPEWIGIVLGLGVIPASLLILTWPSHSYGVVLLAALAAMAGHWWAGQVSDLFKTGHPAREISITSGFFAPIVFWCVYSVPLLFITWLRRAFASRKLPPGAPA